MAEEQKIALNFNKSKHPLLSDLYAMGISELEKIPEPSIWLQYQAGWGEGYRLSEEETYRRQAQRQLGICHALGKGVKQDFAEAKKYFEKAARTYSVNVSDIPPMVDPRAEAELGICHYQLGEILEAGKCFERSANKDDILGNLWLCYLNSVENEKVRGEIEYVPILFRTTCNPFHQPSEDEKLSRKIDKIEREIDNRLRCVAVSFETQVRLEIDLNLDMLDVSDVIIDFLKKRKYGWMASEAKVILALFYQQKGNKKAFLGNLNKARKHGDIISNYLLGLHYEFLDPEKSFDFFALVVSSTENSLSNKKNRYSLEYERSLFILAREKQLKIFHDNVRKQQILEAEKKKEREMLSFFTHTMRNALATAPESLREAIRLLGCEGYEKNQKHYEAINEITALFSTISLTDCLIDTFKQSIYDTEEFKHAWQNDNSGDAAPEWFIASALRQSLHRIIFMGDTTNLRKLINNQAELIKPTRKAFIEQVLPLDLNQKQSDVEKFYDWLKIITVLDVNVEKSKVKFGTNQVKFSLLFAISSELILNSLKYWSGAEKIKIYWSFEHEYYVFRVINSCKDNSLSSLAGTYKGLAFIGRLVELLGEHAQFNCTSNQNLFSAELRFHKTLLE